MKKNKIILLILVTLLFSGCSVKYDLYINNDLSINEKVTASENKDLFRINSGQDSTVAVNSLYKLYKIDGVKYSISTIEKDSNIITTTSASFKSLEDYEDKFESDIFKEVNITKENGYTTLEYRQTLPLTDNSSKSLLYDSISVNIEVPFKVTYNNADRIDGNVYTWNIEKNSELKDIKITFNENETKSSRKIDLGFLKINIKYPVLIISGFLVLVLLLALIVYINNKKNNRF